MTAPAIGSLIKSAVSIATLGATTGGDAPTCLETDDPKGARNPDGSPKTIPVLANLLQAAKDAEQVVKEQTEKVAGQQKALNEAIAVRAALLPNPSPAADRMVEVETKRLSDYANSLKDASTAHTETLKPITHTQSVKWPDNGFDLKRDKPLTIPKEAFEKWVGKGSTDAKHFKALEVNLSIAADSLTGRQSLPSECMTDPIPKSTKCGMRAETEGLYYRSPTKGALIFKDSEGKVLKRIDETIAQLGFVNSLPVNAGPFESIKFEAKFDTDGGLVSAGYTETAAPATGFAALGGSIATQYGVLENYQAGKAQTALDAELKKLQTQASILEAQKKLEPPVVSPESEALTALTSETTSLNAQIALLEAQRKLESLEASP